MKVSAKLKSIRIAPRKVRLVSDLVRGMEAPIALGQLRMTMKGASPAIKKLLESAIANGENNFGLDKDNLYIFDIIVDAGPTLKRWMPKAYGRAGQILKRTSQIEIILEERVEGKGRKSPEQLEKERKAKEAVRKEREKQAADRAKEEETKEKGADKIAPKTIEKKGDDNKPKDAKGNWGSKIFRRKSM